MITPSERENNRGEIIIYQTKDGISQIECHLVDETI